MLLYIAAATSLHICCLSLVRSQQAEFSSVVYVKQSCMLLTEALHIDLIGKQLVVVSTRVSLM